MRIERFPEILLLHNLFIGSSIRSASRTWIYGSSHKKIVRYVSFFGSSHNYWRGALYFKTLSLNPRLGSPFHGKWAILQERVSDDVANVWISSPSPTSENCAKNYTSGHTHRWFNGYVKCINLLFRFEIYLVGCSWCGVSTDDDQ